MKNKEVRRMTSKELEEEAAKLKEWFISHGYKPCVVGNKAGKVAISNICNKKED